jgi:hypothetical protein
MWHSILSGYRMLTKRPVFFLSCVLTLALCIGANSAIFSLVDAVLLRPLPYAQPKRLVTLYESNPAAKVASIGVAPVRVEEWNRMTHSFTQIAGLETQNLTDTSGSLPQKMFCASTSPRFFSVLGVLPLIGREFTPQEEQFGGPKAALLSEELWRSRFGGDPDVLGKTLRLNGTSVPIVGVMPASFRLPVTNDSVDVWIPDALPPVVMRNREARFYLGHRPPQERHVARVRASRFKRRRNTIVTTFFFGLIPAFMAARENAAPVLAQGSRSQAGGSRHGLLRLLVSAQVAFAVVLLVCAGLLLRTMQSLMTVPLGFQTQNILTLRVSASWGEQTDYQGVQHRMKRTLELFERTLGMAAAAIALNPPGGAGAAYNLEFHIAGRNSSGPGEKLIANAPAVSDSYFQTVGIPLLAGEMCRNSIDSDGLEQAMVNRQFADQFFPNRNPVGHTLLTVPGDGAKAVSVVIAGVVADARDTNRTKRPAPTVYWCTLPGFFPDPMYLIRMQGPPLALANTLRRELKKMEPGRAVYGIATLGSLVMGSMGERQLQTVLLSLFGLTALVLASVGLYGVISFYVSQRPARSGCA